MLSWIWPHGLSSSRPLQLELVLTEKTYRKIPVISPPAYTPTQLKAHQFGGKILFQLYPLLGISILQLHYSNYLREVTYIIG